eukprot:TRINITY_DN20587_c0_g1_i1.p1 TRINITY_DN20587_c0_g1~~TRINITY_DN20587_c0_g1_i1.p1  ORF type:complete len:532 (+),score=124.72 TRINITY_DN20587_c0_g1_i1:43-1638(+)
MDVVRYGYRLRPLPCRRPGGGELGGPIVPAPVGVEDAERAAEYVHALCRQRRAVRAANKAAARVQTADSDELRAALLTHLRAASLRRQLAQLEVLQADGAEGLEEPLVELRRACDEECVTPCECSSSGPDGPEPPSPPPPQPRPRPGSPRSVDRRRRFVDPVSPDLDTCASALSERRREAASAAESDLGTCASGRSGRRRREETQSAAGSDPGTRTWTSARSARQQSTARSDIDTWASREGRVNPLASASQPAPSRSFSPASDGSSSSGETTCTVDTACVRALRHAESFRKTFQLGSSLRRVGGVPLHGPDDVRTVVSRPRCPCDYLTADGLWRRGFALTENPDGTFIVEQDDGEASRFDFPKEYIRILPPPGCPRSLRVAAPRLGGQFDGVYNLLLTESAMLWPVWAHGSQRLYTEPNGSWALTSTSANMQSGSGAAFTIRPHRGLMPHEAGQWMVKVGGQWEGPDERFSVVPIGPGRWTEVGQPRKVRVRNPQPEQIELSWRMENDRRRRAKQKKTRARSDHQLTPQRC